VGIDKRITLTNGTLFRVIGQKAKVYVVSGIANIVAGTHDIVLESGMRQTLHAGAGEILISGLQRQPLVFEIGQ